MEDNNNLFQFINFILNPSGFEIWRQETTTTLISLHTCMTHITYDKWILTQFRHFYLTVLCGCILILIYFMIWLNRSQTIECVLFGDLLNIIAIHFRVTYN